MRYHSIRPGQPWLDTEGKPIQAHGGSVMYLNGVYYWYGENKEYTTGTSDIWHWGVRCYTSTDLYNWKDQGLIIPPDLEHPESSLHPSAVCPGSYRSFLPQKQALSDHLQNHRLPAQSFRACHRRRLAWAIPDSGKSPSRRWDIWIGWMSGELKILIDTE